MRSMLFWLLLGSFMICVFSPAHADTSHVVAAIQNNNSINSSTYCNSNCGNNSSGIEYKGHSSAVSSPQILVIGRNYYADHPISYDSQTGQQTWIKNKAAGVSVAHEVSSTHNLSQTLEMTSHDESLHGESGTVGSSGIQMNVKEDIKEGKISIGVLKGRIADNGLIPSATALRNPAIDIEEDYVGNFHIEKNMTIGVPIRNLWFNYSWLPCCSVGYLDAPENSYRLSNAENIFDYTI